MLSFIRQTSTTSCFFCQSAVTPANPRSFRCPQCHCWNRYDARGEIMSDEPAMHEEKLNANSFARRASPSKHSFPSVYGTGQFCHVCQTNQMISVSLMSNYLPSADHPEYAKRLEQLPEYRESINMRYPLVCSQCLPATEDEIRRKDHMSRTHALAGFLKETKGKDRQRQVSGIRRERELQLAMWRLKGALWCITLICVVACHSAAVLEYDFPDRVMPSIPIFVLFSLFYTTWDPSYYSFKQARIQGRDVRVRGRYRYTALQLTAWLSRLLTSILLVLPRHSSAWDYLHLSLYPSSSRIRIYCSLSLALEIVIFITSFAILHFRRPPSIRLVDTGLRSKSCRSTPELSSMGTATARSSSVPAFSTPAELGLSALTLSSKPTAHNPVFGVASLLSAAATDSSVQPPSPIKVDDSPDEYAMDWSPTDPIVSKGRAGRKSINDEDGSWLRPQRFFPPEHPTGLETLFANTKLEDGDGRSGSRTGAARRWRTWWNGNGRMPTPGSAWQWVGVAVVLLSSLVAYHGWTRWNTN